MNKHEQTSSINFLISSSNRPWSKNKTCLCPFLSARVFPCWFLTKLSSWRWAQLQVPGVAQSKWNRIPISDPWEIGTGGTTRGQKTTRKGGIFLGGGWGFLPIGLGKGQQVTSWYKLWNNILSVQSKLMNSEIWTSFDHCLGIRSVAVSLQTVAPCIVHSYQRWGSLNVYADAWTLQLKSWSYCNQESCE